MEGLMKSLVLLAFVFEEDDRFAWSGGASVIERTTSETVR
jgi:hypothetical protein